MEANTLNLPVLALRGLTVFPHTNLTFDVERRISIKALEVAMESGQEIFLVTQRELNTDRPGEKDLYTMGTISRVTQILRLGKNSLRVMVEGGRRARLRRLWQTEPYLQGHVEVVEESAAVSHGPKTEALLRQTWGLFQDYAHLAGNVAEEVTAAVLDCQEPGYLADFIAQNTALRYDDKQAILEELSPLVRLRKLNGFLARERDVLGYERQMEGKVRDELAQQQKEQILRTQIRVLQNELGEDEDNEIEEYRQKLAELKLEDETREHLEKEINKLAKQPYVSAEASVIRNYLDVCLELPWGTYTKERLNVDAARKVLDREHFGLEKVKERILETIAVRQMNPEGKGQIICLAGPPGVGKTSIARSIAESLGRKYVRLSLGGVRDEAEIRGHRRTYIGAMPGKIISAMITAKSSNPLMLLDEIDKLAGDFRGDPAAALLEALDPEQNGTFNDHFLDIPYDLSHVLFITTANDLGSIPGPLRDRMDVIELPSYTRVEKYNIARKHLLPKQLKLCGLSGKVTLSQSALYDIIDGYTREAGVRNLERTITSVLRKCARKIASGEVESVSVTASSLEELLGPRQVKADFLNRTNMVGVANGLAWTSVGGETLPIEVQVMDEGSGKITVTGSLGDVMKESAQLAVTYVRVHAAEYGIDPERLKKCDLHIHAPEGAVPKDGPSAGVTLTTALVSCLSGLPVRGDVAMTGEITLHGNVLPIGGLREKSMAAYREGMKLVLIPKGNEPDLYEVDDEVKKNLEFLPVTNLSQVLEATLLREKKSASRRSRSSQKTQPEKAPVTDSVQAGPVC